MNGRLTGIVPVLPTPFRPDGSVDREAMHRLVRFAVRSNASGLVFPGFASEVEFLDDRERIDLLEVVRDATANEIPLVAGASAGTASEVIAHGAAARDMGIDLLMVQPPGSLGSDPGTLIRFYEEIAAALSGCTLILQNAPAPRGVNLAPAAIVEIAGAVGQIAWVKEESLPAGPAITHLLANRPDTLAGVIGGGGARFVLDEFARGACAAMPAIELTDMHALLVDCLLAGDNLRARTLYNQTLPLLVLQSVYRMRLTKHVMMRRGVLENSIVRSPVPELDRFAMEDIDINLDLLEFPDDQPAGKVRKS